VAGVLGTDDASIRRLKDHKGTVDAYPLEEDQDASTLLGTLLVKGRDFWREHDMLYIRTTSYSHLLPKSFLEILLGSRWILVPLLLGIVCLALYFFA